MGIHLPSELGIVVGMFLGLLNFKSNFKLDQKTGQYLDLNSREGFTPFPSLQEDIGTYLGTTPIVF